MAQDYTSNTPGKSAAVVRAKRTVRTKLERRNIVEEALTPGASIANVARAHGVRPNQVRHWRRLYNQGLLEEAGGTGLVRVTISDAAKKEPVRSAAARPETPSTGIIRIETDKARMYVEGAAEPSCLRMVLEYLLG
jgi:transposase